MDNKINLASINYNSFLNENGEINLELEAKIGVYAIFNEDKNIQYVGYSRNIFKSLQQHLVRKAEECYWYKVYLINQPKRSLLEEIRHDWLQENEALLSDEENEKQWTNPIDVRSQMTIAEKKTYEQEDELNQQKILKKVARRVGDEIQKKLEERGCKMNLRFNPKLKEEGLLDLK